MPDNKKEIKTSRGLTIWLDFGKWSPPKIKVFNKLTIFRICLGWVSFAVVLVDIEIVLYVLKTKIDSLKKTNDQKI